MSLCFLWSLTKPNLSNWTVVPILSFSSSCSPNPFLIEPSVIMISTGMFLSETGSQWMNFVSRLLSGSSDVNEWILGFSLSIFSDLKFRRCISR